MRLTVESVDDEFTSVAVSGDITQDAFGAEYEPLEEKLGGDVYKLRMLLGLAEAKYMDSRGVGWLLKCHRRFRQGGGAFVVHSLPPNIGEVLKVLHLEEVLNIAEDEATARAKALETVDG